MANRAGAGEDCKRRFFRAFHTGSKLRGLCAEGKSLQYALTRCGTLESCGLRLFLAELIKEHRNCLLVFIRQALRP